MVKAIEINQLSKHYKEKKAVNQISLEIEEGEIFGFIGPNGAGKSTTIKMLLNMIFPTNGEAQIFGLDCVRDSVAIKEMTAYVSSDVRYYEGMTSQDIFNYVAEFHQIDNGSEMINDYLKRFDIEPHKKISELSLGNKKKVAIVSALMQQPKLMILDEPTNGLDPMMQHRLFEALEEKRKKGMTIFLSSHDLHEIQERCDRAAFIKNGEIIAVETIHKGAGDGKRVTVTSKTVQIADIEKLGGTLLSQTEDTFVFLFTGVLSELFGYLAQQDVMDIMIHQLELEDKFLSMYE
ncbi:ABC transporter ATP-binding protein [uncultured Vagococcus sp.]|uniref:ABC transporter ATP-binding protein n=1 Tax=uncultured Vagococcus sp. TaxID=189676 RepID=UPI0028D8B77B|nr:ABC transporter ATP-binding protein [uncultured Vagococcus sp.]